MSEVVARGRCLCGATRFELRAAPRWVAHCHCESCRRATGAPVSTYLGCQLDGVAWLGDERRFFQSSPGVRRGSCATCASPMSYESDRWPSEVHLHISTLEDPAAFPAGGHVYFTERIAWFEVHDALPRYAGIGGPGNSPVAHGPLARDPR